jgi:predicted polyphosphate/ATP-dependent NAD kinase
MRIGLVINPVSGLGGAVGLKGTDGPGTVAEALARGAVPQAGARVRRAFEKLAVAAPGLSVSVAPGPLGADVLEGLPFDLSLVRLAELTGTARDTKLAVSAMNDVDLIVFAGGDGTARDVAAALQPGQAMLGIPCGVKMHSGVFALSPEAAGNLLADLVSNPDRVSWTDDAEVMDIDEVALRAGTIAPRLYGMARVPQVKSLMQAAKGTPKRDDSGALVAAAREIAASMEPGTLYLVGPGTSAGLVSAALGHRPTVLGVDAVLAGRQVARDARAAELETLAGGHPLRIILSVTGQQGFLLGRGNQQISASLIRKAGREGLIVLAGEGKLAALAVPRLGLDTGDPDLDRALSGFVRVQTGPGRFTLMRLQAS